MSQATGSVNAQPRHALPTRLFIVTTFMLDRDADTVSVFRPCEFDDRWITDLPEARRFNDFHAELAEQLRSAGPSFTAEVREDQILNAALSSPALRDVQASFLGQPLLLVLEGARLGLTDVGHGAMTLEYRATPGSATGVEITDLGIVADLQPAVDNLVSSFIREVCFLDGSTSSATCLWGHVLYFFDTKDNLALDVLAPDVQRDPDEVRLCHGSGFIKPGLGSSVAAAVDDAYFVKTARVLALISSYYATAAEMDRLIFAQLQARQAHLQSPSRGGRVPDAYDRLFEDVSVFQAVLSTLNLHLAASTASEVRLWDRYAQTWQLNSQLKALTDKLTLLRAFEEREAARASALRGTRLSAIAVVFTVLGFVSTLLALIDFGQDEALSRPDYIRSLISLLVTGGVALVFAIWARRPLPPK